MFQGNVSFSRYYGLDRMFLDGLDPVTKLLSIRNSCTQTKKSNRSRRIDDRFFPDIASFNVIDIMDLIKNDISDITYIRILADHHVPIDFGSHDQYFSMRIDHDIPGHQSYFRFAILFAKILVLLVRKRLDGRSIDYSFIIILVLFNNKISY